MKIAMMIGALTKGGAERVLVNLSDYLVKQGHTVVMVTTYQKENEFVLHPDIKRIVSDITGEEISRNRVINFKRRYSKLRNIWKSEKPDIILSFIGKNNFMNILTSAFLPAASVVAVRGEPNEEYYSSWMKTMARFLFGYADGVILQTKASLAFFGKRVQRKVKILKNPMNAAFLKPRFEGEREKTIVAVGRMDENKNQELLIQAFSQIASFYPDYQLIIYGEGETKAKLEDLVERLKLQNRISLPGNADNIADVIYKTSVFVLPSNTEGMPNTLIEAMSLGLTVISTDCPCGGPAELIDNGVNGLLTPVGDIDAMIENLQKVLNDLQTANSMGEKAWETSAIFNPDKVCKEWEEYLILLNKSNNWK